MYATKKKSPDVEWATKSGKSVGDNILVSDCQPEFTSLRDSLLRRFVRWTTHRTQKTCDERKVHGCPHRQPVKYVTFDKTLLVIEQAKSFIEGGCG